MEFVGVCEMVRTWPEGVGQTYPEGIYMAGASAGDTGTHVTL